MNWQYNEWEGDARWDDKTLAIIEALRAIAEQLEEMNEAEESKKIQEIWKPIA